MAQPEFTWLSVVPTLVGGAISIVTTVAMFGLTQWVDRKKRARERKREEAVAAFVGFWKLKAVAESLGNLRREISDAFASAKDRGISDGEPCDIVRGLVGASSQTDFLTSRELLFLNRANRSDLMAEADLIVRRAINIEESMKKYGEMREHFQSFIESAAESVAVPTGTAGGFSLSGNAAAIARLKKNSMNDFLSQVQSMLEKDLPRAKIAANGYLRVARESFGDDFPKFNLEWVEEKQC